MDKRLRFTRTKKEQQFAERISSYDDLGSFAKNPYSWIYKNILIAGLDLEVNEYNTELKKKLIQEEFEEMIQVNFPTLVGASDLVGVIVDSLNWNKTFFFDCIKEMDIKDKKINRLIKENLTEEELLVYVKDYPTFIELTQKVGLAFANKHNLNIETILIHNEKMDEKDKAAFVRYHKLQNLFTS